MNRDGGGKSGHAAHAARTGRQITQEEAELWHQVGRSLDKVKKKPRVAARSDAPPSPGPVPPPRQRSAGAAKAPASAPPPPAGPPPSPPPPPAELDRRTLRKMAVGKVAIDAVLDLHGLTQETAHNRLRGFLMSCRAKGHRMVLIITGKGANAERSGARFDAWPAGGAQRGVLRRSVPLWLDEPELRAIVVSYAVAGGRHGGDGALYVRLRKAREA
jgi:DNA-nicking Smr family endonuclease